MTQILIMLIKIVTWIGNVFDWTGRFLRLKEIQTQKEENKVFDKKIDDLIVKKDVKNLNKELGFVEKNTVDVKENTAPVKKGRGRPKKQTTATKKTATKNKQSK